MTKFRIAILILALCSALSASAQRVALSERIPKIKAAYWLNGKMPEKSKYTYIEFIHSHTISCLRTLSKLQTDNAYFGEDLRGIIITKESPDQISKTLRECAGEYINVAFDAEGEIFRQFGIRYVPFGIIIDHKRKVLWFGNPDTLNEDFFSKIKQKEYDTH